MSTEDRSTRDTAPPATTADLALLSDKVAELADMASVAIEHFLKEDRSERHWIWLRRILLTLAVLGVGLGYAIIYGGLLGLAPEPERNSVAVVVIDGQISRGDLANADRVGGLIRAACRNPSVQGLALKISSPGGSPSEAERMVQAVETCRAGEKTKPVIAIIDGTGASAALMVALAADRIYANRYAMVGSIGALMSKFDAQDAIAKLGVRQTMYASGELKGMLSTWRADTPAHARAAQDLVDHAGALFRKEVEARRGDRLRGAPEELYSGRTWLAEEALALGLIDGIAVYEEALETEFPGLSPHTMAPRRTLQDVMHLESVLDAVASRMLHLVAGQPEWQ